MLGTPHLFPLGTPHYASQKARYCSVLCWRQARVQYPIVLRTVSHKGRLPWTGIPQGLLAEGAPLKAHFS